VRSMPPILALYETRLTVSDLSRSIAFYRDDVGRRLFCSLTYMVCPQQVWAVEVSILDNLFESRRRTPADNWPTTVPLILDSEVKAFHPFCFEHSEQVRKLDARDFEREREGRGFVGSDKLTGVAEMCFQRRWRLYHDDAWPSELRPWRGEQCRHDDVTEFDCLFGRPRLNDLSETDRTKVEDLSVPTAGCNIYCALFSGRVPQFDFSIASIS
jgi:hypothetical protein